MKWSVSLSCLARQELLDPHNALHSLSGDSMHEATGFRSVSHTNSRLSSSATTLLSGGLLGKAPPECFGPWLCLISLLCALCVCVPMRWPQRASLTSSLGCGACKRPGATLSTCKCKSKIVCELNALCGCGGCDAHRSQCCCSVFPVWVPIWMPEECAADCSERLTSDV
jgi:hypothetical protein